MEATDGMSVDFDALVTDADAADTHTYTGQVLAPAVGPITGIFALNAATGVFTVSGSANVDVGVYTIEITATDDDTIDGGLVLKSATISF